MVAFFQNDFENHLALGRGSKSAIGELFGQSGATFCGRVHGIDRQNELE
jgi:hypothetical protein